VLKLEVKYLRIYVILLVWLVVYSLCSQYNFSQNLFLMLCRQCSVPQLIFWFRQTLVRLTIQGTWFKLCIGVVAREIVGKSITFRSYAIETTNYFAVVHRKSVVSMLSRVVNLSRRRTLGKWWSYIRGIKSI